MKFSANKKATLLSILITFILISVCFPKNILNSITGLEEQEIGIDIYNNRSVFMASNIIKLKLFQTQQEIEGVNKYVGYWKVTAYGKNNTLNASDSMTDDRNYEKFMDLFPNFGKFIEPNVVDLDFRYIMGCNFEVKQMSSSINVTFPIMSKESTNQHVFTVNLNIASKNNDIEEIKRYFENIEKICKSSNEVVLLIKNYLSNILITNIRLQKKKVLRLNMKKDKNIPLNSNNKSSMILPDNLSNSQYLLNSTNSSAPYKNIVVYDNQISIDDVPDPDTKDKLKKEQDKIKDEEEKIKELKAKNAKLHGRANELMDRLDNDEQRMSTILPRKRESDYNNDSANKLIDNANKNIQNLTDYMQKLNDSLSDLNKKKVDQDNKVKSLTDQYNNKKTELNKVIEEEKKLKKSIGEVESEGNVDTETISTIEDKKKQVLDKIEYLNKEIKKDADDIESNKKDLDLLQNSFNDYENQKKKLENQIRLTEDKLKAFMKQENDIKKKIDPKVISTLETEKQSTLTQLSDNEKTLQTKKNELTKLLDPKYAKIFEEAYQEIINKDNFDPEIILKILRTLPAYVWKPPSTI